MPLMTHHARPHSWAASSPVWLLSLILHWSMPRHSAAGAAVRNSVRVNSTIGGSEDEARPQIRIAHLISDPMPFTPMRYMMKYFNRALLPDFDIIIDEYPFRPSNPGLCTLFPCPAVETADKVAVELIGVLSDDTPAYHAITGPFLRQDTLGMVELVAKARVLHVHGGDSPSLSDRTTYPYNFRSVRALQGTPTAMFYIASMNEWHHIVSVWWGQDLLEASNKLADDLGITNYPTLSEDSAAAWAVDAWQGGVVSLIKSERVRVVIAYVGEFTGWQLVCRLHKAKLSGIQYFRDQSWSGSWYLVPYPPGAGGCTPDEMYIAVRGHLVALHTFASPGVVLSPELQIPPFPSDQSQLPLTCMSALTAQAFYGFEQVAMAVQDGWVDPTNAASIEFYLGITGLSTDAVCAALLALHETIYTKNVSASSIADRDASAFATLAKSMEAVEFQGATGSFNYYPSSGDPEYIFYVLAQQALPGRSNSTLDGRALITFPDGPLAKPVFMMLDEVNFPLIWADNSTGLGPKPHLGLFPDCGLTNGVLVWDRCEPCPAGTAYDELLRACRTCPLGQYQNQTGRNSCETAPRGWYVVDVLQPVAMAQCPSGHECPQAGTVQPQPCAEGRYASSPGYATCSLCPRAEYQNSTGAAGCISCEPVLHGGTTADIASVSPSQCICPEGTFREAGAMWCSPCLEGMECPQGTFPLVKPGYMTIASEPLVVYLCAQEGHCPGGPPGTCALRRDPETVACGECTSNSYEAGDECLDCGAGGALPLILTGVAGACVVLLLTILINKDVHKTPAASLMIVAVSGLLFTSLQTMGVFAAMDIPWEEPVKSLLDLTRVLSFDLDLLKVSCVMGVNPVRSFTLRQVVAICVIPFVAIALLLKKYMPKFGRPDTLIVVELCNSAGTFFSIFFISIVISALDPFICYKHPGSSGESVQSAPSLLCFEEGTDHASMIIVGLIAMFVIPVPFFSLCLYAIGVYPRQIKAHSSSRFLHATRFLFFRYVPQRYYFQVIVLSRSFVLCLIPAIMRGKLSTQVLFMCFVLCSYVIVADNLRPWRVENCNLVDTILGQLLVVLLLCGALFIEGTPQRQTIAVLSSVIFLAVFGFVAVALAYALRQRLAPSYFNFFICHHKAHAAGQSRYLKVLLQKKKGSTSVFIDSDNLQELDSLFDIVKSRVRHLVVYLTADTLKRPWCVGEIVTALRARLQVTRLHTPSFAAPTEEQCSSPEAYVDTTGCNLSEYGIQWTDVTKAFGQFLGQSMTRLDLNQRLPGTQRFEHAVGCLLKQRVNDVEKVARLSELRSGGVLVVTHTESDEANASAGILIDRIAPEVYRACEQGISLMCDYEATMESSMQAAVQASVVVVILSQGCLQSLTFAGIICELMAAQGKDHSVPAVISVNTPGFQFPSPAIVEKVPVLNEAYSNSAADYIISFFKRISVLLPTHAAQGALNTQSDEIFRRIEAGVKNKSVGNATGSSSTTRLAFNSSAVTPLATASTPIPVTGTFTDLSKGGLSMSTGNIMGYKKDAQKQEVVSGPGAVKVSTLPPYSWVLTFDDANL